MRVVLSKDRISVCNYPGQIEVILYSDIAKVEVGLEDVVITGKKGRKVILDYGHLSDLRLEEFVAIVKGRVQECRTN